MFLRFYFVCRSPGREHSVSVSRGGPKFCVSNKLPGNADAATPGPHFETQGAIEFEYPCFRMESGMRIPIFQGFLL